MMSVVEYLPDFEPLVVQDIPSESYFAFSQEWLRELADQCCEREEIAMTTGDKDQARQVTAIVGTLRTAWRHTRRLYVAQREYRLLCTRVLDVEARLHKIKSERRYGLYFSEWNKYRVYRDMCDMFGEVMAKCQGEVQKTCDLLDEINEKYIAKYEETPSDME